MSPVEIPRSHGKTVRLEFVENTSYAGVDYGPDYQARVAEVREDWARYFIRNGKARRASPATALPPQPVTDTDPGAIPDDFPEAAALAAAGIQTFAELEGVEDLTSLDGIGRTRANRIAAALADRREEPDGD